MDSFTAYRLFQGVKLHFTNKTYDVFVTKGHIKGLNSETVQGKRDYPWFINLSKKFNNVQEYIQYCVAVNVYGSPSDIYDIDKSQDYYKLWLRNKSMLTRLIEEDIEQIDDLIDLITGDPPKILSNVISGKINIETATAINKIKPFISPKILKKDYLCFADIALKIIKLEKFLKYDFSKIESLVHTKYRVSETH